MAGGMAHGECKPKNAAGINNSGTITGVGSDSVGTQVAMSQNTTGGTQVGLASSNVDPGQMPGGSSSTASPGTTTQTGTQAGGGTTTGYNPLTDPNLRDKDKPVDTDKVKDLAGTFQQGQWKPFDTKDQNVKNQPWAQPQPSGYVSPPGTAATPTQSPTGTTTTPTTRGRRHRCDGSGERLTGYVQDRGRAVGVRTGVYGADQGNDRHPDRSGKQVGCEFRERIIHLSGNSIRKLCHFRTGLELRDDEAEFCRTLGEERKDCPEGVLPVPVCLGRGRDTSRKTTSIPWPG